MQLDNRLSPVPALQHLRSLHPGALQHLQQSPDGSLYAQTLPQAIYQQPPQQQYALNGHAHQQRHAVQYQHPQQHQVLPGPGSPAQFAAFPTAYQQASSPRFGSVQQLQGSPPPSTRTAPQLSTVQAFQQPLQQKVLVEGPAPPTSLAADDAAPLSNHSSHFQGLKLIAEPPDLDVWRQRLFDVDDTITLTEEEYVNCWTASRWLLRMLIFSGSTRTFPTLTTSTRTAPHSATSATAWSRTIGTVVSRAGLQEPRSQPTPTRRSANESLANATSAM
jgi:hypothetical protein